MALSREWADVFRPSLSSSSIHPRTCALRFLQTITNRLSLPLSQPRALASLTAGRKGMNMAMGKVPTRLMATRVYMGAADNVSPLQLAQL